ncbi:MAG: hypothetical protein WD314_13625 [Trueperaceae bacterium]
MTPRFVEQVFLSRNAGAVEALLVLEDEAGARSRERFPISTASDFGDAARWLARMLARRGVRPARKVRLRVGQGEQLRDAPELLGLFLAEWRGSGEDD